jgi:HAD superfamily hydrolase (TIGR01509 family)
MILAAIVFDFDGLIVDTENPGFISWEELYQEFGATLSIDDWRYATGYVGGFDPGIHLEQILGRRLDWSQLMPKREARNWELTLQAKALPGIEQLLLSARERRLRVGVASNSESGWVEGGLRRLGLRDYVDTVVTRDMVMNPKPAPDIYLKTVQTLQVESSHAVALEDSEPGCRAAKRAGLKAVAIPNRFSERQDLTIADLIVKSATELNLDRLSHVVSGDLLG